MDDATCSVGGCDRKVKARGWCNRHYLRWQIHGHPEAGGPERLRGDARGSFDAKVDKSGECWIWTGALASTGYGQLRVAGVIQLAHRLSYEWANGEIPAGAEIDHRCHVRSCVNPAHLRLATKKQNMENPAGLRQDNKSGVRGVSWHRQTGKWRASVGHNGRRFHVGLFASLAEAEAAVITKRNDLFTHNDADRTCA